jgi:hypothetical protein
VPQGGAGHGRRAPRRGGDLSGALSALDSVLWTELLDRTQLRHYFPDAVLRAERVAGMVKSLIAVKSPPRS